MRCEAIDVVCIMLLFARLGDLRMRSTLGTVQILAVAILLRTPSIDRTIGWTFPTVRKLVPWHLRPVARNTTITSINSNFTDNSAFDRNKNTPDDAVCDENVKLSCASNYNKISCTRKSNAFWFRGQANDD